MNHIFQQFSYQVKQAWFGLKNKPWFVLSIVSSMGLTLGALLCILTLAYLMLAKPLPYPEQEKLYWVEHNMTDNTGELKSGNFSYPGLTHFYEKQTVFEQSALIAYDTDVLTSSPTQPMMSTSYITPDFFTLLNTPMVVGRSFEETEAKERFNPVAIISYDTWKNEFNGDKDILANKITFNNASFRIVGVTAQSFIEPELHEIGRQTQVWLPWDYNNLRSMYADSWAYVRWELAFVGKLKSDFSQVQAEQSISPFLNELWQENVTQFDFYKGWQVKLSLKSFKSVILGDNTNRLYLLLASITGLLVIACANISNLFISRTAQQQKPLAIHAAIGATKKQLFKTLLVETGLLMTLSAIVALIVASFGFFILQHYLSELLPRINELSLSVFTLSCALLFVFFFAILFAQLSNRMINYQALNHTLQSSGKGTGIQVSQRIRQCLIISQVAIATSLVFVNISLFNSATTVINTPAGHKVDNIFSMTIAADSSLPRGGEETISLLNELKNSFLLLPQVEAISQSSSPLRTNSSVFTDLGTEQAFDVEISGGVDKDYFNLLEQTLLEGDYFSTDDIQNGHDVVIINDIFAKKIANSLATNGNFTGNIAKKVIGRKINIMGEVEKDGSSTERTIVGIVKGTNIPDVKANPMQAYRTSWRASNDFLIKFKANQKVSRELMISTINSVSGKFTLFHFESMADTRKKILFTHYTTAITTTVLTLLTIFLAAIGLYGILSYSTQSRRFEIGTRMAIGAKRKDLITMILKDNSAALMVGAITSVIIILALYLSFSESLTDYVGTQLISMFLITLALISTISFFACYLPLRQYINHPAIQSLKGSE